MRVRALSCAACLMACTLRSLAQVAPGDLERSEPGRTGMTPATLLQLVVQEGKLRWPRQYHEGSLVWSADGKSLFYTNVPRRGRDSAASLARFDIRTGHSSPFAAGSFLTFSPDARRVIVGDKEELRIADVDPDFKLSHVWRIPVDNTGSLGLSSGATLAWSPDSRRAAFVAVTESAHEGHGTPETRYASGFDLRIADLHSRTQRTIHSVKGTDTGIGSVAWPTDQQLLIAIGRREGLGKEAAEIAFLDPGSGRLSPQVSDGGFIAHLLKPVLSPDGRWLSYWQDFAPTPPVQLGFGLAIRDMRDGSIRRVAHPLYADGSAAAWGPEGKQIYFLCKAGAVTSNLCIVDAASAAVVDVRNFSALENIDAFALSPDGLSLAWHSRDVFDTERVRILGLRTGARQTVWEDTLVDPAVTPLGTVEPVSWHSFDGLTITGLLVKPVGYVAGRAYPTIVDVHGGPNGGISLFGALLNATPLEWQMWASQGYAVLVVDYRESGLYSRDNRFRRREPNRYAYDEDTADIVSGTRYLIDTGIADPKRLVIIGHSHGSVVTNWLLTRTACFAGAITKEGRADWRWMPPGWERFYQYYFNTSAADLANVMARNSAIDYASRVHTPVLYVNGEYGLGVDEGQRFVEAINKSGGQAEWLHFAAEGHVIASATHLQEMLSRAVDFVHTVTSRADPEVRICDVPMVLREEFPE